MEPSVSVLLKDGECAGIPLTVRRSSEMSCLVSVVLPTHNRAHLLPRAINSVLSQTHDNLELIVVDDGSTDDTYQVAARYEDPRVSLIRLTGNHGAPYARNVGITMSKGSFIAFLDSDDEWRPVKLEKQVALLLESPRFVGAAGAGVTIRRQLGDEVVTKQVVPKERIGNIQDELLSGRSFPGKPLWPGSTSSILIRKECLEKVGGFDENLRCAQEHDLYIRLSKYFDFVAVPEPLVIRHSDAGDSISSQTESQIAGKKEFLRKHKDEFSFFSRLKANFLFHVGVRMVELGSVAEGRRYLLRAVLTYPLVPKYWANLARSLVRRKSLSGVH